MNKNIKKSIIIVSLGCAITALSCAFLVTNQKKSMAQEVNNICEDIVEDVESMRVVSSEIAMSSNPYDYIKNCDAYDDLVALGKDAIPEIGRQIVNGSNGLNEYMLASAIEEISGRDVYEETGIDWSTGEEFVTAWNKMIKQSNKNTRGPEDEFQLISAEEQIQEDLELQKDKEKNKHINYSFFYYRTPCRDCKVSFDERFLDNYGNRRQNGIIYCDYHKEKVAPDAELVETGYTDNNCLSYALGNVRRCTWMWPKSWSYTPSPEVVKEYFQERNYITEDFNETNMAFYKEKKAIFVYAEKVNNVYQVVHFGRTDYINGEFPEDFDVVSKWGLYAVYKTKTVNNSFTKQSGYGECVFVMYK